MFFPVSSCLRINDGSDNDKLIEIDKNDEEYLCSNSDNADLDHRIIHRLYRIWLIVGTYYRRWSWKIVLDVRSLYQLDSAIYRALNRFAKREKRENSSAT